VAKLTGGLRQNAQKHSATFQLSNAAFKGAKSIIRLKILRINHTTTNRIQNTSTDLEYILHKSGLYFQAKSPDFKENLTTLSNGIILPPK